MFTASSSHSALLAALVFVAGAALPVAAFAQDKPSTQPLLATIQDPEPDLAAWARAYEQADRPRVLVVVGEATSRLDYPSFESLLALRDPGAIATRFKAAFEQVINDPAADVDLVDLQQALEAAERLQATLDQSRQVNASQLMARELQADLLITIRLTPSQRPGSPFAVLFEAVDPVRGRSGLTFTFDWKLGTTAPDIRDTARQVARKFIEDYAQRAALPRRYTLRLFGMSEPSTLGKARDALESVEGVRRVRSRTASNVPSPFTGDVASAVQFELTLEPGADADPTRLMVDIDQALRDELQSVVELVQTEPGMIALRTLRRASAADLRDECERALTFPGDVGDALRARLAAAYARAGSPRILVLVNRAPIEGEAPDALRGVNPENLFVVSAVGDGAIFNRAGQTDASRPPAEDFRTPEAQELLARRVEQTLNRRLGPDLLGLSRIVNPDTARLAIAEQIEARRGVVQAGEFAALLKKFDAADLVILGTGRIDPRTGSVSYTFTATNLETNLNLAYASVEAWGGVGSPGAPASRFSDSALEAIADHALARLGCDLLTQWESASASSPNSVPAPAPAPAPR